jgi:hypothetical protein
LQANRAVIVSGDDPPAIAVRRGVLAEAAVATIFSSTIRIISMLVMGMGMAR